MKYKAVLFDLDGTLLDTLKDIADSVNAALSQFGFPVHKVEAYKYFIGDGREVMVSRALPERCREEATVSKVATCVNKEYAKRWPNNARPYAGIPRLLDALSNRDIRTVILSNKPDDFTKLMASKLLSRWQFEVVAGSRPLLPRKPDPSAAMQIALQLNIQPSEFLYLGDSGVDMMTAVAAGMYPVGALWGFRDADELLAQGARELIKHPPDLLSLL